MGLYVFHYFFIIFKLQRDFHVAIKLNISDELLFLNPTQILFLLDHFFKLR